MPKAMSGDAWGCHSIYYRNWDCEQSHSHQEQIPYSESFLGLSELWVCSGEIWFLRAQIFPMGFLPRSLMRRIVTMCTWLPIFSRPSETEGMEQREEISCRRSSEITARSLQLLLKWRIDWISNPRRRGELRSYGDVLWKSKAKYGLKEWWVDSRESEEKSINAWCLAFHWSTLVCWRSLEAPLNHFSSTWENVALPWRPSSLAKSLHPVGPERRVVGFGTASWA